LENEGLDVMFLLNKDVTIDEINAFFGVKQGKNGWKYNNCATLEEV